MSEDFIYEYDREYNYSFTYQEKGITKVIESGTVTPTDNSGSKTIFNGLTFDKTANFLARTFDLQIDYEDELDRMFGFTFLLKDLETGEEKEFSVEKNTEVQSFTVDEMNEDEHYYLDIVQNPMSYTFTYYLDGNLVTVVEDEEFTFTNSLHSEITDVQTTYDFTSGAYVPEGDPATSATYCMPIKIDFNDEEEKWSSFSVTINDSATGEVVTQLDLNEGESFFDRRWHYVSLTSSVYIDEIANGDEFALVIWGNLFVENSQGALEEEVYREKHVFTRDRSVGFYDMLLPSSLITNDYRLEILPIFTGYSSQMKMRLELKSAENTYLYDIYILGFANSPVSIDLSSPIEENWDEEVFRNEVENGNFEVNVYYYTYEVDVTTLEPVELEELAPSDEQYTKIACYSNYRFVFEA